MNIHIRIQLIKFTDLNLASMNSLGCKKRCNSYQVIFWVGLDQVFWILTIPFIDYINFKKTLNCGWLNRASIITWITKNSLGWTREPFWILPSNLTSILCSKDHIDIYNSGFASSIHWERGHNVGNVVSSVVLVHWMKLK